jgi:ParB-like chromosome segregation protein Spo0J
MRDPRDLTGDELLALVTGERWFAAKDRVAEEAEVVDVPVEDGVVALAIVEVRFGAGTHEHYLVALGADGEPVDVFERPEVAARLASSRASRRRVRAWPLGVDSRTAPSLSTGSTC